MIKKQRIRSKRAQPVDTIKNWTDKLRNIPCFLIGAAPSLNDIDLDPLKDYFTIAINRAFYRLDPSILIWQDRDLYNTEKKKINKLECIKYCSCASIYPPDYYFFRVSSPNYKIPQDPTLLHGRGATGPLAFQLAYLLGCNPIILVGMDCCYRGQQTNFYGKNYLHNKWTLANCVKGLEWIKKFESKRIIINSSKNAVFSHYKTIESILEEYTLPKISRKEISSKLFSK